MVGEKRGGEADDKYRTTYICGKCGKTSQRTKFIESCKGLSQKRELQRIRRPADVRKMIRRKKTKLEEGTPFLS
jgi:hypothetical protein